MIKKLERVFNKKLYPDYVAPHLSHEPSTGELMEWGKINAIKRSEWVEFIGGPKNEFLRDFLIGKKLA